MATILVVRHPDGNETEHEIFGDLRIGRQDGNDIILTEGGVSRQHARIFLNKGKVMLEDLGSANGTYLDGERIGEMVQLTPISQVVLGDYELKLKSQPVRLSTAAPRRPSKPEVPEDDPEEAPEGPRATRAMPTVKPARPPGASLSKRERPAPGAAPPAGNQVPALRGLTGPWANKTYPLKNKLLVGRAPPAVVLLEDDSISRKHAEVERNAAGTVLLRDLGSANGTLLNGERIGQEPVEVMPGDIIQFGMVELVYENGEDLSNVPVRRRGGPARGAAKAVEEDESDAPPRKSRKLLVVAGTVAVIIGAAGIAKQLTTPVEGPGTGGEITPPPPDPKELVQKLLSECRSYSSMEMGNEPQWDKAEAKCEEALNLDPINTEANTLIKRIQMEKDAAENFTQGAKLLQRLKEEDALDVLRKIPKESEYFRRAKIKADEALEQVKVRALDDCKRYLRDSQYAPAVPRCDRYMSFWCQGINPEEITPPVGFAVSLEGKIGKKEWRPKDKLFLQFLVARQKMDPKAEMWKCPELDIVTGTRAEETPEAKVKKMFKEKYPNPYMNAAMVDYWGGRGNEALAKLQKVRNDDTKASLHGQVDLLIKDVSTVDQLFKTGSSLLQTGEVEKAAEPFDEALEVDKRVMSTLWETIPSFYRHNIQQDIADKAYERGRDWSKRDDQVKACRIWKTGFRFYKGNTDLIRVLSNICSTAGTKMLPGARTCPDLNEVEVFAVPGDGLDEKIAKKREELKCTK